MFKKIRSALGRFTDNHTMLAGALSMILLMCASFCVFFFYGYLLDVAVSEKNYCVALAVSISGAICVALFIAASLMLFYPGPPGGN